MCLYYPKAVLFSFHFTTCQWDLAAEDITAPVTHVIIPPQISSLFLDEEELQSPASLSSERVSQLGDFLPLLGVDFLRQLTPAQLLPALPDLATVPFTPNQVLNAYQWTGETQGICSTVQRSWARKKNVRQNVFKDNEINSFKYSRIHLKEQWRV